MNEASFKRNEQLKFQKIAPGARFQPRVYFWVGLWPGVKMDTH